MIYHRTSTRMAIIKGTDKYWQRCGETNPYILLVFLKKLNLPYNPAVPFPGIYSREMKMHIHTKTVAWTFIAALSKIAPPQNGPGQVAQLVEHQFAPKNSRWICNQGTYLCCHSIPCLGCIWEATDQLEFVSHLDVSLFLLHPSSLSKIKEHVLEWGGGQEEAASATKNWELKCPSTGTE